jgi:hypothetical protein
LDLTTGLTFGFFGGQLLGGLFEFGFSFFICLTVFGIYTNLLWVSFITFLDLTCVLFFLGCLFF